MVQNVTDTKWVGYLNVQEINLIYRPNEMSMQSVANQKNTLKKGKEIKNISLGGLEANLGDKGIKRKIKDILIKD